MLPTSHTLREIDKLSGIAASSPTVLPQPTADTTDRTMIALLEGMISLSQLLASEMLRREERRLTPCSRPQLLASIDRALTTSRPLSAADLAAVREIVAGL